MVPSQGHESIDSTTTTQIILGSWIVFSPLLRLDFGLSSRGSAADLRSMQPYDRKAGQYTVCANAAAVGRQFIGHTYSSVSRSPRRAIRIDVGCFLADAASRSGFKTTASVPDKKSSP